MTAFCQCSMSVENLSSEFQAISDTNYSVRQMKMVFSLICFLQSGRRGIALRYPFNNAAD